MAELNLILIKYLGICVIFNLRFANSQSIASLLSHRTKLIFSVIFVVLLQACATKPLQLKDVANIAELKNWNARGKLLLTNNKDKLSGYFFWQQNQNGDFKLVITSFIGTNLMTLDYQNRQTEIKLDGKTHKGAHPEQLVYNLTGSYIPVLNMATWMLAQAPESAAQKSENGQLKSFNYRDDSFNNWQIDYQSYKPVSQLNLPEKMTIKGLNNRIKITINEWELLAQ